MKRDTAEKLMEALAWMEHPMTMFAEYCQEIEDESERSNIRRAIGNLMGRHFTDVMIPIIKQYPDLGPDKTGAEWYQSMKAKYADEKK